MTSGGRGRPVAALFWYKTGEKALRFMAEGMQRTAAATEVEL